jgi:hypothetical protein
MAGVIIRLTAGGCDFAMWWRLGLPLALIFGRKLIPRIVGTLYLVWKLSTDPRVPLLLKLLTPGSLIYLLTPLFRIPFLGPVGFLVVLLLAMWALITLAPQHVVEYYAPWRARGEPKRREEQRSRVVEGSYHVVDDEEPGK